MRKYEAFLRELKRRVMNSVMRAVVKGVNDNKSLQRHLVTLLAGEVFSEIPRVSEFGFASQPQPGAEAVIIFPGGDRSHGIIIATEDRRYRMKVGPGKVAIYDDEGQYVYIKEGGVIEIKANTKGLVTAPLFEASGNGKVNGNLEVTGNITGGGNVLAAGTVSGAVVAQTAGGAPSADVGSKLAEVKTKFNAHTHVETGSTTNAVPGGQQIT